MPNFSPWKNNSKRPRSDSKSQPEKILIQLKSKKIRITFEVDKGIAEIFKEIKPIIGHWRSLSLITTGLYFLVIVTGRGDMSDQFCKQKNYNQLPPIANELIEESRP